METVETQKSYQTSAAPVGQLNTHRSLLKFILLGIVTLGIYPIVFYSGISSDINVIASRYDGQKTMHYCLVCFLLAPITLGIVALVWFHNISKRVGNEVKRRGFSYEFGAADFWLWGVLGALIIVGPYIYIYKLATASNMIAEHYNING